MNFENSFTVGAPPATVWGVMMDLERVAPCMPGAEVLERTGDDAYKVQVRVKVGPMSMVYQGQAKITGRDDAALTAAMRVQARETRGQGAANATVRIKVGEHESGTQATLRTDLKLSGRAAAMGRGVITDVSQALVSEFAQNLAQMLSEGQEDGGGAASAADEEAAAPSSTPREPAAPPSTPGEAAPPPAPGEPSCAPEALDAGRLARTVLARRLGQPGTLALVCLALGFMLGRRSRSR